MISAESFLSTGRYPSPTSHRHVLPLIHSFQHKSKDVPNTPHCSVWLVTLSLAQVTIVAHHLSLRSFEGKTIIRLECSSPEALEEAEACPRGLGVELRRRGLARGLRDSRPGGPACDSAALAACALPVVCRRKQIYN